MGQIEQIRRRTSPRLIDRRGSGITLRAELLFRERSIGDVGVQRLRRGDRVGDCEKLWIVAQQVEHL